MKRELAAEVGTTYTAGMRSFVIGDVHGCLNELRELVALLNPQEGDRFFFLGDLVDRGPDSAGTVRYVRSLTYTFPGSICLAGNHEEVAVQVHMRGMPGREGWESELTEEEWDWLQSLPLLYRVSPGILLVHGGLYPAFFRHYPDEQALAFPQGTWHRGGGRRLERLRRVLRVRYVDSEGEMVALGQESTETVPWASVYDGAQGFVFYGHDFENHGRYTHAHGLDYGCVYGSLLAAAVLENGDYNLVTVQAHKVYRDFTSYGSGHVHLNEAIAV